MRVILGIIAMFLFSSIYLSANEPYQMKVSKDERDNICGLQPYKYPRWMSEIELINGKKLHFASVKCMMLFYFKNDRWSDLGIKDDKFKLKDGQVLAHLRPQKREAYIKAMRVTDYKTTRTIDAKKAYYVFGSRVISPIGDDLVPFQYEADAKEFIKEFGGSKILRFSDFKLNLFDLLNL